MPKVIRSPRSSAISKLGSPEMVGFLQFPVKAVLHLEKLPFTSGIHAGDVDLSSSKSMARSLSQQLGAVITALSE